MSIDLEQVNRLQQDMIKAINEKKAMYEGAAAGIRDFAAELIKLLGEGDNEQDNQVRKLEATSDNKAKRKTKSTRG